MHPPSPSAPTTRHRTALAQLQSSIALGSQSKATAPAAASSAPASSLSAGAAASHSSSNPTAPLGKENRAATPSLLRGVSAKNARGTSLTSSLLPLVEDDDAPDSSEEAAAAGSSASASSLSLRGLFNPAFDAPSLPATNVGKTTHTNMGDMKERINAATLAGRAIARGAASPASALTTPQRSVNDENAIFAEERDLFAPRNTPATPAFTPMPLAARQTTPASFLGQRLTRDVVPTAGKLAELRTTGQRTSLFPSTAGSASSLTARGSAAGSSDAASMLHHGIDQVLSTKDSARRYIEVMRKKMAAYIVLNREYANTHATEQMRNQGIITLRKTLESHIKQLQLVQKELKLQYGKRDAQMRQQLEQTQQELTDAKSEIDALQRAQNAQTRADNAEKREQKKQWDQLKADLEHQLANQKADAAASSQQLNAALEAANADKDSMAADAAHMTEEINELRSQLTLQQKTMQRKEESWQRERQRMQQQEQALAQAAAAAASSRAAGTSTASEAEFASVAALRSELGAQLSQAEAELSAALDHGRRCEVGLENACNELDHVLLEKAGAEAASEEAVRDLETMLKHNERSKRKYEQLEAAKDRLEAELRRTEGQLKRKQIELDEMTDIKAAFQHAYETTETDKKKLHDCVATLSDDVIRLRDALSDLSHQQFESIPLPMEVLEWNPEQTATMAAEIVKQMELLGASTPASANSTLLSARPRGSAASQASDSTPDMATSDRSAAPSSFSPSIVSASSRLSHTSVDDLSESMHELSFGSVARRLSMSSAVDTEAESQPGRAATSASSRTTPISDRQEQSPLQSRSLPQSNRMSPQSRMSSAPSSAASSPSEPHRHFHERLQHRRQQRATSNSQRIQALLGEAAEEEQ